MGKPCLPKCAVSGPAGRCCVFSPALGLVIMSAMPRLTLPKPLSLRPPLQIPVQTCVLGARLGLTIGAALLVCLATPLSQAAPVQLLRATNLYSDPVGVSRVLGQINAGAVVDTTGGRYGPWVEVRVKTGPAGWVQALDLAMPDSGGTAPPLPASMAVATSQATTASDARPVAASAAMDAAMVSANTPGMNELVRASTFAVSTETARAFGFSGGLELVKLPRAARRTPANVVQTPPIEPTNALKKTMGQSFAAKLLAGRTLVTDVAVQHYINLLGRWLSAESTRPDLDWTFAVVNDTGFNAFSAPGGYVFVTQGLLERVESEAELAGILAHEIVMVAGRFHLRGGVIDTPGLPDQLEADVLATELCARTGLEANGLSVLLKRLADRGWFQKGPYQPMIASVPDAKTRLAHISDGIEGRFDNLEVAPTRRIPDRLAELKTQLMDKVPRAAAPQ